MVRPGQRRLAWGVSIALHAAVLIAFAWWNEPTPHQPPLDPDRLVFIEPAPPPPPAQEALMAAGEEPQPPEELPVDQARLVEPEATVKPTAPRRPSPRPTATARPAARPSPSTDRTPSDVARSGAAVGSEAGVEGGVAGGTEGGIAGGVVGGRGTEVVKAEVAAKPPMLVKRVLPVYPLEARRERIEGQVLLRAIVDKEGRVEEDIVVLHSTPPLDAAAVAALRQWRFTPGRDRDGNAVRVQIDVPLRFQLQ